MWYDRVQRHMIFKVGKMAKNVEEWVASESKEDCDKIRMSLKPEKYALPMIRLTFGDEVLALPQNRITEFLAGYDSLKKSIVEANSKELKEAGVGRLIIYPFNPPVWPVQQAGRA